MPKFCDSCGAPLGEAKRFCTACGAPILGREDARAETSREKREEPRRACAFCGAPLEDGAAFCEACGERAPGGVYVPSETAKAAADEIARRYSPLWLIPLLLTALALFAVPASLQAAGVPEILKNPLAWAVLLAASAGISLTLYWLLRRSKKALRKGDPTIGGDDKLPPGTAASVSTGAGVTLGVTLLAALVLLALNLSGLGGGSGGRHDDAVVNPNPAPTSSESVNAPVVTAAPTEEPAPKEQTLEGIWLPEEAIVDAEGIQGPNMVMEMPSILFENGCMYMGLGTSASDIREDAYLQNSYIAGFDGFPFTYSDGVITIETLGNGPAQTWTIDSSLTIYTSMGTFYPQDGAQIVDKG